MVDALSIKSMEWLMLKALGASEWLMLIIIKLYPMLLMVNAYHHQALPYALNGERLS